MRARLLVIVVVMTCGAISLMAAPTCKQAIKQYRKGTAVAVKKSRLVKKHCARKKAKTARCIKAITALQKAHERMDIDLINAACAPGGS